MDKNASKYQENYDKPVKDVKKDQELPDIDKPSAEELRESGTGYPTATGQNT